MKGKIGIAFLLLLFSCASQENEFPLFKSEKHFKLNEQKAYVLMFFVPDCPFAANYTQPYKKLARQFSNLPFYMVLSGEYYSEKEIENFKKQYALPFEIILDKDFTLAKKMRATHSPHFYLIDENQQVLYNGRLDDWAQDLGVKRQRDKVANYLQDAILAYQNNTQLKTKQTKAVGCVLEY